jgi:hypothetical protein
MNSKRRITSGALSVRELLSRPVTYRVPVNQRDYSWSEEEIDTLWEDLTAALDNGRGEYFLGAVVLSPGEGDASNLEIVDGQQRLATLTMILSAIRLAWLEEGDRDRAADVHHQYLGSRDRKTKVVIPKLSLNENNDPVFHSAVLEGVNLSSSERKLLSKSNQLIVKGFERIKKHLKARTDSDVEDALIELEEYVAGKVNVISIEVGDDYDAFVIFETLNDRGLELAVSDLVKNYLFSQADDRLSAFKKNWSEISLLVGAENLTPFLRHLWLSEYEFVRERDLYRLLRERIKTKGSARQFMDRLRKAADLYAALQNPDSSYWADLPDTARESLRVLRVFRATQFRPLAMAVMEGGEEAEIATMLRIVVVLTLRYTIVSGYNANELERIYSQASLAIRKSGKRNPKSVFTLVKEAYVPDQVFAENFSYLLVSKSDVARYIYSEINRHLEADGAIKVDDDRVSLEHILPKNPGKDWAGAIPKADDPWLWTESVGNVTLLEKSVNRGLGSKDFQTKKTKGFNLSKLALNAEIKTKSRWTSTEIAERSKVLAKTARIVWRFDS